MKSHVFKIQKHSRQNMQTLHFQCAVGDSVLWITCTCKKVKMIIV